MLCTRCDLNNVLHCCTNKDNLSYSGFLSWKWNEEHTKKEKKFQTIIRIGKNRAIARNFVNFITIIGKKEIF